MKAIALSIRQPWASLIVWGIKNVEVRSWRTNYRGRLIIHAGLTVDDSNLARFGLENLPTGALIGTVDLTEVQQFTEASWDELAEDHLSHGAFSDKCYAWHLTNPKPFEKPIPYSGKQGLFQVMIEEGMIAPPA